MSDFENSTKAGTGKTEEAGSSIGDQLRGKGVQLTIVPNTTFTPLETVEQIKELITMGTPEQPIKKTQPRGGRRTQANPEQLNEAIDKATGVTEIIAEKNNLLLRFADFKIREEQANKKELSDETKEWIQKTLRDTQKKLIAINQRNPELVDPVADQQTIQDSMDKHRKGEKTLPFEEPPLVGEPEILAQEPPESIPSPLPTPESEEEILQKSLIAGTPYARGGEEALGAINAIMERNEREGTTPLIIEPKPLRSPYEAAIARIEENKKIKREEKLAQSFNETLVPVTTVTPEEPKIKPILSREEILALVEKNKETRERATFTALNRMHEQNPAEAEKLLEAMGPLSMEQKEKFKTLLGNLEIQDQKIEATAEKKGLLDKVRSIGEAYKEWPLKKKLLVSTGLILLASLSAATGGALGGAIATAALTGSIGQRMLGGIATFITIEGILKASAETDGRERGEWEKRRHTAEAVIAGILVGGGVLSHAFQNIFPGITPPQETLAQPPSNTKIEFIVEKGSTLWGGIEAKLDTQGLFANMEEGQKNYVLAAIKNKFAAMSPEELQLIGFSSGNIDLIHPGDTIDLTKVLGDAQFIPDTIHNAEILSSEQVTKPEQAVIANPLATEASVSPARTGLLHAIPDASTPSMPQEFTPTSSDVVAAADRALNNYIDNLFGTKGFLGFGAENGMDSIHWKDSTVGFANQSVDKVMVAHPSGFPEGGVKHFGIEDYSATQKMQEYLVQATKETGINPNTGEKVGDYLKRAAINTLSKTRV